jgi:ADP-dependent NAD(P)H-hydrate dehydratase
MPGRPRRNSGAADWRSVETLSPRFLRGWQLPRPADDGDKESRGRVLVVAGSAELPGAAILSSTAALRAGAGKLRIATGKSIATAVGASVPEARVYALSETAASGIDPGCVEQLAELANGCQATLIGPGLLDTKALSTLLANLLPRLTETMLVLDAEAVMAVLECPDELYDLRCPALLTPHAGEMATLLGESKDSILRDLVGSARRAAARFRAVIVLKSAESIVADPDGRVWRNRGGTIGLATSGSGDTLAGIIAGLAARSTDLAQAACWGVYLHHLAGERLSARVGPLGFLAREILVEIPAVMAELAQPTGTATIRRSKGPSRAARTG